MNSHIFTQICEIFEEKNMRKSFCYQLSHICVRKQSWVLSDHSRGVNFSFDSQNIQFTLWNVKQAIIASLVQNFWAKLCVLSSTSIPLSQQPSWWRCEQLFSTTSSTLVDFLQLISYNFWLIWANSEFSIPSSNNPADLKISNPEGNLREKTETRLKQGDQTQPILTRHGLLTKLLGQHWLSSPQLTTETLFDWKLLNLSLLDLCFVSD